MLNQKEYTEGNNFERRDTIIAYLDAMKEKLMKGEIGDILVGYTEFHFDRKPESVCAFFGTVTSSLDPIKPTVLKVMDEFSDFTVKENSDVMVDIGQ